ncbi:MAG TPA: RNA polymerase factor sigma-32 [Desulfovibrio sp.]|uniref:RNA polymerase factor sigma-32 n=1 Tax=Desulfovibrio sp. TaxID=885 RepID=UPI002D52A1E7|nr:RNA polymerase factor sigma-32 [Desulfovibrio sp.]HZF62376.1 RNA polymerase factor sigma-32 [Desulfovibrio sp.]
MKKDSPIAPKNPRSAQKAEETEISSPEVEILDAPPSRKRAAPAGGGTRGAAAKARSRSTEGKAARQSILDVDGSAVREVPADSVSGDQDDDDALADSPEDVDVELDASDHDIDPIVLEDDHEGLPAPSTTRLPAVGPRDSLHLYLREVSRFPLLKPDEEHELALRVRDHNDADAAFRLVSSHLRLVVRIAMDFQRRWMQNVLDLVQEGNVGLMRAVNKFDPDKGIKFSYYASFWIKAYILKFIMDNWRMVKIGTTQVQRKLFYNLNRERQKLIMQGFDPDAAMLSERLGVTEDQINEMDQRLASTDMSLNVPVGEDAGGATRMDFLPALGPGIEDTLARDEIAGLVRSKLKTILPKLNEKELYILQNRLLTDEPVTLREIGERYNVTRERVRQLEARLLEKIRQHLAVDIKDFSDTWIQS